IALVGDELLQHGECTGRAVGAVLDRAGHAWCIGEVPLTEEPPDLKVQALPVLETPVDLQHERLLIPDRRVRLLPDEQATLLGHAVLMQQHAHDRGSYPDQLAPTTAYASTVDDHVEQCGVGRRERERIHDTACLAVDGR